MKNYQKIIKKFVADRDWDQFHNPKDLLLGIVEEIGELRNIIKWEQDPKKINNMILKSKAEVEDHIGDIMFTLITLANKYNIDIEKVVKDVIKNNTKRFPVEKFKSRYTKSGE